LVLSSGRRQIAIGKYEIAGVPNVDEFILFAGSANPKLADAIAQKLNVPLGKSEANRFPDGEVTVRLRESVRQKPVFILQSTSPPVNDHLMELLAFVDACRRASADRITAIVPYFGYSRADKRHGRREPITASMVAVILQAVGVDRVVTLDLHAPQIEGFFQIPVDCLTAVPTFCEALRDRLPSDVVIVSPDTGRVKMATQYAQRLNTDVVILHKQRESGTQTEVTRVVGEVRDRSCLIIDDMVSTGGTIAKSVDALLEAGARPNINVAITHGLFLEGAESKLSHEGIQAVFATDTVSTQGKDWSHLHIVSIAPLLAAAIERFAANGSLSDLF
jgi:ribose-phosphate pyrophosphokinase